MFIYGLFVIAQNSIWSPKILCDLGSLATVLERIYSISNERLGTFETENSWYLCEYEGNHEARQGRPRFSVPERQLIGLHSLNFTWKAISEIVGVSERSIRHCHAESSSSVCESNFSCISDDELDTFEGSPYKFT